MKRIRLICFVVAVIVFGGLVFVLYPAKEPSYEGRNLSEWIEDVKKSPHTELEVQAASHALKQMAPDAIPILLKWVQAKDEPAAEIKLKIWLMQLTHSHSRILRSKPVDYIRNDAFFGFQLLGSEAKPAWPVLIQWTSSADKERRLWAFECLAASKPDKETFLPVLTRLFQDPDKQIQEAVAYVYHDQYPQDAETAGVYKVYPFLKNQPRIESSLDETPAK
jgi:hypothetical protein